MCSDIEWKYFVKFQGHTDHCINSLSWFFQIAPFKVYYNGDMSEDTTKCGFVCCRPNYLYVFCFYHLKSKSLNNIFSITPVNFAIHESLNYRSVLQLNIYFMRFMLCFNVSLVVGGNGQLIEWSSISDSLVYWRNQR